MTTSSSLVRMKGLLAISIVLAMAALLLKLAAAPLYGRYNASECRSAYARAHNIADTARVDLHPYGAVRGPSRRCGEVRARTLRAPADISALRRPSEDF